MEETLRQSTGGLKIVLYGPESSGKSTMARALSEALDVPWVAEFMRTYLEQRGPVDGPMVSKEEVLAIARGQMALENEVAASEPELLICDTNLLELKVYSQHYFDGWCPEELINAVDQLQYDHYFLTQVDIPWEADSLRDRPLDRENMFRTFERELQQRQLPYTILEGSHQERMETALQVINQLKTNHNARSAGY